MKNYYQFSAEEVKQDINGKQEPLTVCGSKSTSGEVRTKRTGRREEERPHFRSFWSNTKISL